MPQRRLLFLDASHLSARLWQAGTLTEEASFPVGNDGVAAFAVYLAAHAASHYYFLADIAEEGFQTEHVPYTQGADRTALLARRLGQYFYGSPLATAISFGREKEGRRDERILFTALTRPQLFEPWLAALRAAEVQLAGIYSLPLLGAALLAKVQPAHERCLLVTATAAGVRQSYFENGQIRFSRMTPLARGGIAEVAATCAAESAKMYQYLLGQRSITRGAALPAIVLAHPDHYGEFAHACRDSEDLHYQVVDLHALGRACGLKSLPADSFSEALFLHLLAQRAPRDQFAPPADRRFYRLWQVRATALRVGAAALVACLLFAGKQFYEAFELRSQAQETAAQAAADGQRYAAIQATYPPTSVSADALRTLVDRYGELDRRSPPLEPLYLAISRALRDAPAVDVERIEWQVGSATPESAARDAPRPAPADKGGSALHAVAIVHGTLPAAMTADQRAQLDAVIGFEAALRKDAALKVVIQQRPFDIESGKSLKSGSDAPTAASQPKFVVQLSRKL